MLKLLVILLIVFGFIYFVVFAVKVFIKKNLNIFFNNFQNETPKQQQSDVIYNKDDITVLKGEAKNKKKEPES